MMGETGIIVRLPGTLDPTAEEFTPANRIPFRVAVGVPYPYFSAAAAAVTHPTHLSSSPTRSLLLTPVPLTTETALRRDLEVFGDVRAVQTEALHYGIVTVHFYDLRHAETAFTAIRNHHMHYASFFSSFSHPQFFAEPPPPPGLVAGHPLWANYVLPAASNAFPGAHNQGTIVVFNLDSDVSAHHLRQIFESFGPIKEVRDTPWKKNQRFVEFFDARDAAKALKQMNGKEIYGKPVVIEFSKPGGHGRSFSRSAPSPIAKKPLHSNMLPLSSPPPPPPPPLSHSPRRRFAPRFYSSQQQLSHKKSAFNRGSPSVNSGSVVVSTGSMSLSGDVGNRISGVEEQEQEQHLHAPPRRYFVRKHSSDSNTVEPRRRHWKGKPVKNHETRYLIKEDAIVESSSRDSRTTVMIKNIPNKYSQKLLLNMLDNHCRHCNEQIGDGDDQPLSSYDFVYLPIDFNNKCNVGYGFVNMTSPEATLRLYKAFHLQHWEVFNSRKICEVTYARVQGLEALKEHFKNSRFPWEMDHYLPVVFSPPRDGRVLTEPLPVAEMMGNKHQTVAMAVPVPYCSDDVESGDRVGAAASAAASDDAFNSKSGGVGDDDTSEKGGGGLASTAADNI